MGFRNKMNCSLCSQNKGADLRPFSDMPKAGFLAMQLICLYYIYCPQKSRGYLEFNFFRKLPPNMQYKFF